MKVLHIALLLVEIDIAFTYYVYIDKAHIVNMLLNFRELVNEETIFGNHFTAHFNDNFCSKIAGRNYFL